MTSKLYPPCFSRFRDSIRKIQHVKELIVTEFRAQYITRAKLNVIKTKRFLKTLKDINENLPRVTTFVYIWSFFINLSLILPFSSFSTVIRDTGRSTKEY